MDAFAIRIPIATSIAKKEMHFFGPEGKVPVSVSVISCIVAL